MPTTYSVKADNCNSPKITYEVKELPAKSALFLANHLSEAFRNVEVVCEQTGEIAYQFYYNDDFRKTTLDEVTCLAVAQSILKD
jgi:hypothetical protein